MTCLPQDFAMIWLFLLFILFLYGRSESARGVEEWTTTDPTLAP